MGGLRPRQRKLARFAASVYAGREGEPLMRKVLILSVLLAGPALAQPPRQQSPAPREMLESLGSGNSDEAIAAAIAAAAAHPLGSLQNPVRVAGPDGERAYLARLRCADGKAPAIGRAAPAGVGAYGTLVDAYPLDCGAAAPGQGQPGHRPLPRGESGGSGAGRVPDRAVAVTIAHRR
jgi:hypothetical protein